METAGPSEKRMRLRRAGTCRICATDLPPTTVAVWEKRSRTVRCLDCAPSDASPAPVGVEGEVEPGDVGARPDVDAAGPDVEPSVPGASARREYEKRKANAERHTRERHRYTGGLRVALGGEARSTSSWATGAVGEERIGAALNERVSERLKVLHDRRIPGSRANIDHLVVTPGGVWIVDPKRYRNQRPTKKVEGGILRPRVEKLTVGGRDRTKLVDGALKQLSLVREAVGPDVPIRPVLCFVEGDWPLFGGPFVIDGVEVTYPRKLYARLDEDGPLDAAAIDRLHRSLASAFPSA